MSFSPSPPLTRPTPTPKAFQRRTGAHAIIAQLLLADLIGCVLWLLIGALSGPLLWWCLRAFLHMFHASLLFDLWATLVVSCMGIGRYRQRTMRKNPEEAWGCVGLIVLLSGTAVLVTWLVKSDWMRIQATVIPAVPLEALSFHLVLVPQGAGIAVLLSLVAHLSVLRRARTNPSAHHLALSRVHLDGPIWQLVEQVYALYRRDLARFEPSPIRDLKTPPTFYYYQRQPTPYLCELPNPEHELYWHDGDLIINRAYIGPKDEQTVVLLPLLARLLYDYNTPDRVVEHLFHLAQEAERFWLTDWLLMVPLSVKKTCEQQWEAMARERVLDRDWFAYVCGQGRRLRKWLRLQLQERTQHDLPDNAMPTLAERIDHLDSLLRREEQQVQRLRDALSSPEE